MGAQIPPRAVDMREHTILLVDLGLYIEIDASDYHVGKDVESAHAVEDSRVVEGNLLGDLHKTTVEELGLSASKTGGKKHTG